VAVNVSLGIISFSRARRGGRGSSGKTTLVNRILRDDHGIRIAVIENEFGEVDIDGSLVASQLVCPRPWPSPPCIPRNTDRPRGERQRTLPAVRSTSARRNADADAGG
jgi:hypothetical protein